MKYIGNNIHFSLKQFSNQLLSKSADLYRYDVLLETAK